MAVGLPGSPSRHQAAPTQLARACRGGHVSRKEGQALRYELQPFFTLNHAAYNAGRNSRVSTVATINPPMIATAIGP